MTKPMIGLFLFGCGSAPVDFSASLSAELDGGIDARAVMGSGGASSGGARASSGGAVNTGGAVSTGGTVIGDGAPSVDPACGPTLECTWLDRKPEMNCKTAADCCRGFTCPGTGFCEPPQKPCTTDAECPCQWECYFFPNSPPGSERYCAPGYPP